MNYLGDFYFLKIRNEKVAKTPLRIKESAWIQRILSFLLLGESL